jgi:hypothetical protein
LPSLARDAQVALRTSEYSAVDFEWCLRHRKGQPMKAAIYAVVLGLTLVFASAGQAGHMM